MNVQMVSKRSVGMFLLIIAVSSGCLHLVTKFSAIAWYRFSIDCRLSDRTQDAMKNFIVNDETIYFSSASLSYALKKRFPYIHSLVLHRSGPGLMDISIKVSDPCIIVNDDLLLLKNGALVNKQVVKSHVYEPLYALKVPALATINNKTEFIRDHLAHLSEKVFNDYRVELHDEHHALLHDKSEQRFSILFNKDVLLDEKKIAQCNRLKQRLLDRDMFIAQSKGHWVADIRFKDQIVLYARKGDNYYG